MRPRFAADARTLLWCLAMPLVAAAQYVRPGWSAFLWPVGCYLALSAGVIAHNHNHCPTFKNRKANSVLGMWLSIFYGYPTFAWIPTHNLNHHKFVNKAGDATITWRYTNRHNWLVASTFFYVSSYWQSDPIKEFIAKARSSNRALYRQIGLQYFVWAGTHAALLGIACGLFGFVGGLKVWGVAFFLPAFFALWTIMLFNYIQHVHTDPWSEHNHSRSFTGKMINFMLFNNGLHTAHHEMPGAHWSTLREQHEKIAAQIHPDLKPVTFFGWCFRTYVLALVSDKYATAQVGRAPYDPPGGEACDLTSGNVDAVESGINAARV